VRLADRQVWPVVTDRAQRNAQAAQRPRPGEGRPRECGR
jgi:hypothetical protein